MKSLKEKIQKTTRKHKKGLADNIRDNAIHIGNLKNISPGDKISVYNSNFYHTTRHAKVHMIDKDRDAIYLHFNQIKRFHMFNCKEWGLEDKKPNEKGTTRKENRAIATGSFCNLVEYPIINITYKSKLPISKTYLCYDKVKLEACPYLTWAITGSYWCTHLREYLFQSELNSKGCK